MRSKTNVCSGRLTQIHSTAIVSKEACVKEGVQIGPFSVIGNNVTIGKGTIIGSNVIVECNTTIGENNRIFPGAIIGAEPQIAGFNCPGTGLKIGNNNVIREYVTIHRGGEKNSNTIIEDNNFIMIGCHIAHDCLMGSGIIMANGVMSAGHVKVSDYATLGGMTGIHQFVRIGEYAMLGAMSRVSTDILPYSMSEGNPVTVAGVNLIGLKRSGFSKERIQKIKKAFRTLFFSKKIFKEALKEVELNTDNSKEVECLVKFIQESKRGITGRR